MARKRPKKTTFRLDRYLERGSGLYQAVREKDAAKIRRHFRKAAPAHYADLLCAAAEHGRLELLEMLIRAGADPEAAGDLGQTPLMSAAGTGNEHTVQMLLDAGADANGVGDDGDTPLIVAARAGQPRIVRQLLDSGADAKRKNAQDGTALVVAAERGDRRVVEILAPHVTKRAREEARRQLENVASSSKPKPSRKLRNAFVAAARDGDAKTVREAIAAGMDMDTVNGQGTTALHAAADAGQTPIVNLLLRAGANTEVVDREGLTPVFFAAKAKIVEALAAAGANVNQTGWGAAFPLSYTTNAACASALVKAGADVNQRNDYGMTGLMVAAANGRFDVVRTLIAAGADVNATDRKGQTALFHTPQGSSGKVSSAIVELVKAGASLEATDNKGKTALDALREKLRYSEQRRSQLLRAKAALAKAGLIDDRVDALNKAVSAGQRSKVTQLIDRGCDVNAVGDEIDGLGISPLAVAVGTENLNMVQLLLEKGADPNSARGPAPLVMAARRGATETAECLLRAGADPNQADEVGTPLHHAVRTENVELVESLLAHSAKVTPAAKNIEEWAGPSELDIAEIVGNQQIIGLLKSDVKRAKRKKKK